MTIESDSPTWNLTDLFSGIDDPRVAEAVARVRSDSAAFSERYHGRVGGLEPASLRDAVAAYERIAAEAAKPVTYASLLFAAHTMPANGAFLQRMQEETTSATLPLIFFDVELSALGAHALSRLADAAELCAYRHYLQTIAARAAHTLSEVEERLIEEQANTGRRAFTRLYQEITAGLRVVVAGTDSPLTLSQALDLQYAPGRETRRNSARGVSDALAPQARTIAFIFNTLLQDKATMDRLRGYEYPEQARHIDNELRPETVEVVVGTAAAGYPLVARFYEMKRRLLDLPELAFYDRYAPLDLPIPEAEISFADARRQVLGAFEGFDAGTYAAAANEFFDKGWIDAAPRQGKRGGAFCSSVTPDLHPYLLLSFLRKPGDVKTLAHELGHGIHSLLARDQSYFNYHGTLPMAEVASTFAEMLVFEEQTGGASALHRLAAYGRQIEQGIATIFRQTALYRFEQAIHATRRASGELTVEQFGELWQKHVGEMFGGSVTLDDTHALWWSYVSHFVATPFYVYAYSFGEMLALALFRRYKREGGAFTPLYLDLLRAGGSLSPHELVAPMGIDLDDPAFWQGALDVFEGEVSTFERLAEDFLKVRATSAT